MTGWLTTRLQLLSSNWSCIEQTDGIASFFCNGICSIAYDLQNIVVLLYATMTTFSSEAIAVVSLTAMYFHESIIENNSISFTNQTEEHFYGLKCRLG